FVISDAGHVLTSCHLIDHHLRDQDGNIVPAKVETVRVQGAIGSSAGTLEPMTVLQCAQEPVDLALIKFDNSLSVRQPVVVFPQVPDIGANLASMGFPLR